MNLAVRAPSRYRGDQLPRLIGSTLLGLLIPTATFSRNVWGESGSIVLAGVLLAGSLVILVRAGQSQSLPRQLLITLLSAAPIIAIYLVSTMLNPSENALTNFAQLVLAVGFMAGLSLVGWNRDSLQPLFWIFTALLFSHVLWWLAADAPRIFRGFMGHPNGLGLFALLLGFVPVLVFLRSPRLSAIKYLALLAAASSLILLYATTSRANWLAAALALATFAFWPIITRTRTRFQLTFLLIVLMSLAATWLYMLAPNYSWGWQLQELSLDYTGKNLFSGRHLFWGDLGAAISTKPWFGHGAGSIAETFTSFGWSSHNLYLQTALQVGFVGLACLLGLLWVIWGQLWRGRQSVTVRLAAAYFLGIVVHQVFEVSLTQNNLANGFLIWLILAIGLSHAWRAKS